MKIDSNRIGPSRYGTLGLDVGRVGHLARLVFGAVLLLLVAGMLLARLGSQVSSGRLITQMAVYFLVITGLYTLVYGVLGARGVLQHLGPWANTAIFVGPAFVVAWWNFVIGPITGVALPEAFWLAMLTYIGLSFLLQWRLGYGGCEVVALPILLYRQQYPTYCIPLVALDAVEKAMVDRQEG